MRTVEFYVSDNKHSPVEEFLESLPSKLRQKVVWVLKVIEQLQRVSTEYLKKLSGTDGLWEIRATHGKDAVRLLGFWDDNNLIILTNGFVKKTDKIPQKEIALALQRKASYERRKLNG